MAEPDSASFGGTCRSSKQEFTNFKRIYFASNRQLFEQLSESGQKPETLFITCCDSRVVPNLITNAAPGELFIIRNIGNIVPSVERGVLGGVSAAIEYATEVLEVGNVIVCGHTQCGAIDAILHPESVAHLPFVSRWIGESSAIPKLIEDRYGMLEGEARKTAAVQENVLVVARKSALVQVRAAPSRRGEALDERLGVPHRDRRRLHYDPHTEQFVQVGDDSADGERLSTRPPAVAP